MNSQENLTQITFHLVNGQTESFNILHRGDVSVTGQELQQQIMQFLDKPWCILHLPEQTVCIQTSNVLKVEIKPSLREFKGEGVFSDARRVTAFTRTAQAVKAK